MPPLTTAQAAQRLGIKVRRVQQLIESGRLSATRFGRAWLIDSADLERVRKRPVGRPKSKTREKRQ